MTEENKIIIGTISNEDIFKYLTGFREEFTNGIRKANYTMKEKINAGVKEMKINIDKIMMKTEEKIEELRSETKENSDKIKETENWFRMIERRMEQTRAGNEDQQQQEPRVK